MAFPSLPSLSQSLHGAISRLSITTLCPCSYHYFLSHALYVSNTKLLEIPCPFLIFPDLRNFPHPASMRVCMLWPSLFVCLSLLGSCNVFFGCSATVTPSQKHPDFFWKGRVGTTPWVWSWWNVNCSVIFSLY